MSGSSSLRPKATAAAPAEALSFAVHSMPAPVLADERRTRAGRVKMLALFAMCAAPVVASYFTYFVIRPDTTSNYSELITPTRAMPDLPLKDLQGKSVSASSLEGQWLLVVVASGRCDEGCEGLLFLQRQLRETLGRDKARVDKLWLVSDDLALRPEVVKAISLGTPARVLRVPREALSRWLAPAAGHSLEQHLYVVDPMGHWMMRAPANPEPAKLKSDIEKLLRASASWDLPGR